MENIETVAKACPPEARVLPMRTLDEAYILDKIEQIIVDTAHIYSAIQAIESMPVNNSLNGGFGDQAKGEALGEIVKSRETTNQKIIGFLERLYDDLNARKAPENI